MRQSDDDLRCAHCGARCPTGVSCDPCYLATLVHNLRSRALRALFGPEWTRDRMAEARSVKASMEGGAR